MDREKFLQILRSMNKVCQEVNQNLTQENPENKLRYEVLQLSDIAKRWDSVYRIAEFYNYNWLGNRDYMHIPDFRQVLENCKNYPVIIAREEGNDDILAISSIKYDENSEEQYDPYFPEKDAHYFSVTGILVKKGTTHRGMGKKIYEIAVRGVHDYKKEYSNARIMCVIDCRNRQSLRALASAVDNINENHIYGENKELPANIVGYYELKDLENGELREAPTIVLEVGLEEKEKSIHDQPSTIEYHEEESKGLFDSLRDQLRGKIKKYGIKQPIVTKDEDEGMVYFYPLDSALSISQTFIKSNGTERGNDRDPMDDEFMKSFVGPVEPIFIQNIRGDAEEER